MNDQRAFFKLKNEKSQTFWILLTGLFTALTAVGAFLRIPIGPVPFTMQLFFVLLTGNILRPRFAFLSQAAYLTIGLSGLPIFSNGGGPGYLLQPSFGYILAFPFAALIVALISEPVFANKTRRDSFIVMVLRLSAINLLGVMIILGTGVIYLYLNLNLLVSKSITFSQACVTGMVLFLPWDALKAIASAVIAAKIKNYPGLPKE